MERDAGLHEGFMDPEDTLEMMRDVPREQQEGLTITERTKATAQAGLQPFSYDVHVRLGMELLALRQQEALMKLDAEQFGEKLKRRAFIRDMLKQVAKEENWVQNPASDVERISKLLPPTTLHEDAVAKSDAGPVGKGQPSQGQSGTVYAKWLERKRRAGEQRAAFGTSVARELDLVPPATKKALQEEGAAAMHMPSHTEAGATARVDGSFSFARAPRLAGAPEHRLSGSPQRRPRRSTDVQEGGSREEHLPGTFTLGTVEEEEQVRFTLGGDAIGKEAGRIPDSSAGTVRRGAKVAFGNSRLRRGMGDVDLANAADLLGLGGADSGDDFDEGGGARAHSYASRRALLAAAAEAVDAQNPRVANLSHWRLAVRRRSPAHSMSEISAFPSRGVSGEWAMEPAEPPPPIPQTSAQLEALEAAAAAVAAISDDQVRSFAAAVETSVKAADAAGKAAAAAAAGAPPEVAAAQVAAARAAASRVLLYDEAAIAVESLVAAAAERLETARSSYEAVHAAKLAALQASGDLHRQMESLREWASSAEGQRLETLSAALAAQAARLASVAGEATPGASPQLGRLVGGCESAAAAAKDLNAALAEAGAAATAAAAERERRRQALLLIEEECVRLAEEMTEREETERLAAVMAAEAEAERRMAEADTEQEVERHARLAALLMGEEEWMLEKEARSLALRVAHRDQARLAALRAAEVEKDRERAAKRGAAGEASAVSSLLQELIELEREARSEVASRSGALEEALRELARFQALRAEEQARQARQEALAAEAEAEARQAAMAVAAAAAEAGMTAVAPPPQPAPAPPLASVPAEEAGHAEGPADPAALFRAALELVEACRTSAEAAACGADGEADLERDSRAACERMAAARATLEAMLRLRALHGGSLAELGLQGLDVALARRAVERERAQVAELAACAADPDRQVLLRGVADECERLYRVLVEADGEGEGEDGDQSPAPSVSEGAGEAPDSLEPPVPPAAAAPVDEQLPQAPSPRPPAGPPAAPGSGRGRGARDAALDAQAAAGPAAAAGQQQARPRIGAPSVPTTIAVGFNAHTGSAEWSVRSPGAPGSRSPSRRHAEPHGAQPSHAGAHPPAAAALHPQVAHGQRHSLTLLGKLGNPQGSGLVAPYAAPNPAVGHLLVPLQPPGALLAGAGAGSGADPQYTPLVFITSGGASAATAQARRSYLFTSAAPRSSVSCDYLPPIAGHPSGSATSSNGAAPRKRASDSGVQPVRGLPVALRQAPPGPVQQQQQQQQQQRAVQLQARGPPQGDAASQSPAQQPPAQQQQQSPQRQPTQQVQLRSLSPVLQQLNLELPLPLPDRGPRSPFNVAAAPAVPSPPAPAPAPVSQGRQSATAVGVSVVVPPHPGAAQQDSYSKLLRKQLKGAGSSPTGSGGESSDGGGSGPPTPTLAGQAALSPGAARSLGLVMLGDQTYSQWVAAQSDATSKALEAAKQVDDVLSRLPPELHHVLLNAAELLSGMVPELQQPAGFQGSGGAQGGSSPGSGASTPGRAPEEQGAAAVPRHLQSLPPTVVKYMMGQLQRIYTSGSAGAGSGAGGNGDVGAAAGGGGSGGAVADLRLSRSSGITTGPSAEGGSKGAAADALLGPPPRKSGSGVAGGSPPWLVAGPGADGEQQQQQPALLLLNAMLPGVARSLAVVRTRVAPSLSFEPRQAGAGAGRSGAGSGLHGAPLRASRKGRAAGPGQDAAPGAHDALAAAGQQAQGAGAKRVGALAAKASSGGRGSDLDVLRQQHDALGFDRWLVRGQGVNGAAPQSQPLGQLAGRGGEQASKEQREALTLPPLLSKSSTLRN